MSDKIVTMTIANAEFVRSVLLKVYPGVCGEPDLSVAVAIIRNALLTSTYSTDKPKPAEVMPMIANVWRKSAAHMAGNDAALRADREAFSRGVIAALTAVDVMDLQSAGIFALGAMLGNHQFDNPENNRA